MNLTNFFLLSDAEMAIESMNGQWLGSRLTFLVLFKYHFQLELEIFKNRDIF